MRCGLSLPTPGKGKTMIVRRKREIWNRRLMLRMKRMILAQMISP